MVINASWSSLLALPSFSNLRVLPAKVAGGALSYIVALPTSRLVSIESVTTLESFSSSAFTRSISRLVVKRLTTYACSGFFGLSKA